MNWPQLRRAPNRIWSVNRNVCQSVSVGGVAAALRVFFVVVVAGYFVWLRFSKGAYDRCRIYLTREYMKYKVCLIWSSDAQTSAGTTSVLCSCFVLFPRIFLSLELIHLCHSHNFLSVTYWESDTFSLSRKYAHITKKTTPKQHQFQPKNHAQDRRQT